MRILDETVVVTIKNRAVPFKWFNVVDLKKDCDQGWLCMKGTVGITALAPGEPLVRETMFRPAAGETVTWQDFLDGTCASTDDWLDVTITGEASSTGTFGAIVKKPTAVCRIDLRSVRGLIDKYCKATGAKPVPVKLAPDCGKP